MSEIKEEASSAPDGADEMRNPENVAQEWAAGRISSSSYVLYHYADSFIAWTNGLRFGRI